jgi:hypothetical protein
MDTPVTDDRTRQECETMATQLMGDGPIELTEGESNALRAAVRQMIEIQTVLREQFLEVSNVATAMASALSRHGLRVTHQEQASGDIVFDLENVPQHPDKPVTLN